MKYRLKVFGRLAVEAEIEVDAKDREEALSVLRSQSEELRRDLGVWHVAESADVKLVGRNFVQAQATGEE